MHDDWVRLYASEVADLSNSLPSAGLRDLHAKLTSDVKMLNSKSYEFSCDCGLFNSCNKGVYVSLKAMERLNSISLKAKEISESVARADGWLAARQEGDDVQLLVRIGLSGEIVGRVHVHASASLPELHRAIASVLPEEEGRFRMVFERPGSSKGGGEVLRKASDTLVKCGIGEAAVIDVVRCDM